MRSCPTAALSLSPTPGTSNTVALELDPAACIGCDRCLALCPVQALTDHGPLSWVDLAKTPTTVLETVQVKDCERCRAPFGGEGALCQVCQMRRTKPFGSWLPPGYVAPRVYAARQPDSVTGLQEEVRPDDLGDR